MPRQKPALSDEDLLAILRKEEQAAASFQDGTLAALRRQALAYYDRQPYGDEQEGASQVVTSEFADVIESLMPGLMRVFTAADDLVRFTPGAPGQEKWAEEASAYVPHVLMRENDGFRIISGLLKDALMYRLSGVTVDLEEVDETRTLPVRGLPQDAVDLVVAAAEQQGATVTLDLAPDPPEPHSVVPSAAEGPLFAPSQPPAAPGEQRLSGTITLTHRRQRVAVENIAPEDIRFSPGARAEDKASFLGFIKRATASELAKHGLSPEEIDDLNADRPPSTEDAQRNEGLVDGEPRSGQDRSGRPDSERPLWLVVAYIRADTDGDGRSELERVVYAHGGTNGGRIIERMPWEGPAAIALATPILMPHSLVGRSLFDQTQDLQLIGSVITRGLLDNLYLVNRPRPVISDHVNIDSLIDWTPGSPIRLRAGARPGDNHVAWLQVPNVTDGALTALEHLATVRENRTGVSRYNQGLDADSLNKTLGGLDRIMSASQQRQDLIARVFAETAIKRLYRLIYRAIKRAAAGPLHYWPGKGSAFASCDPSRWPDDMDLSVDVVGIGNREQALGHLALVGSLQEKLLALQGGANGPFVTVGNVANAAQKLAETLGYPHKIIRAFDEKDQMLWGFPANKLLPYAELSDPNLLDLEVVYVGQAYGDGSRSALDRLKSHETLQRVLADIAGSTPEMEAEIVVFEYMQQTRVLSFDGTAGLVADDADDQRMMGLLGGDVSDRQVVGLAEAGLIRYFEPPYNEKYKATFPAESMKVLEDCYRLDFAGLVVEVDTEELKFRLFSKTRKPGFHHLAQYDLVDVQKRRSFFSMMDKEGNLCLMGGSGPVF